KVGRAVTQVVSAPAHIGSTHLQDHRVGLKPPHGADDPDPVVGVSFGTCSVKPELDQGAVVGAKLLELPGVKLAVRLGIAVTGGVAVPRRAVKTGQDPFLSTGVDKLADHIAFPVPPRRALDGVGRRLRRPKAKAVVVLGGEDGIPHARFLDRKSTRLNSSHVKISYAVFCLKKKKRKER